MTKVDPNSPAADKLRGARAIGLFMGCTEVEAKNLLQRGIWPAGKEGHTFVASKKALTAWWERTTNLVESKSDEQPEPEPVRIRRKRPSMPRLRMDQAEVPNLDPDASEAA